MLIRENVADALKLDPKIKLRWFAERIALILPLFLLLGLIIYLLVPKLGYDLPDEITFFYVALAIAITYAEYSYVQMRYGKFVYALREKDFLIQKGIIEKIRYIIPYEKIQNVTVSRDYVDVLLGLGTLHVETAAHQVLDKEITLPGIPNDSDLVNELISRSRRAKDEETKQGKFSEPDVAILNEILSELKLLRKALSKDESASSGFEENKAFADSLKRAKLFVDKSESKKKK